MFNKTEAVMPQKYLNFGEFNLLQANPKFSMQMFLF